jgi:hypothetical protein
MKVLLSLLVVLTLGLTACTFNPTSDPEVREVVHPAIGAGCGVEVQVQRFELVRRDFNGDEYWRAVLAVENTNRDTVILPAHDFFVVDAHGHKVAGQMGDRGWAREVPPGRIVSGIELGDPLTLLPEESILTAGFSHMFGAPPFCRPKTILIEDIQVQSNANVEVDQTSDISDAPAPTSTLTGTTLLEATSSPTPATGCIITVFNPLTELQREPDPFGMFIVRVPYGEHEVLSYTETVFVDPIGWYQIEVDGYRGWVEDSTMFISEKSDNCLFPIPTPVLHELPEELAVSDDGEAPSPIPTATLLPEAASSPAPAAGCIITVFNPLTELQREPDPFGTTLTRVPYGEYEVLDYTEEQWGPTVYGWYLIEVDDSVGWVENSSIFISEKSGNCLLPTPTPSPVSYELPNADAMTSPCIITIEHPLNRIHSEPGHFEGELVAEVPPGTYEVIGYTETSFMRTNDSSWFQIEVGEHTGWIENHTWGIAEKSSSCP